jgi:prevent-host-death family protein
MTTIKTTIPITEARKRIFDIAEEVQSPNKVYTITEGGRPKMVIMSAEEYESWLETREVLRDFPDHDKEIAEADEAVRTGSYKKWASLEDMMGRRSFVVAEKSKKKYGVRIKNKTKSRKKA